MVGHVIEMERQLGCIGAHGDALLFQSEWEKTDCVAVQRWEIFNYKRNAANWLRISIWEYNRLMLRGFTVFEMTIVSNARHIMQSLQHTRSLIQTHTFFKMSVERIQKVSWMLWWTRSSMNREPSTLSVSCRNRWQHYEAPHSSIFHHSFSWETYRCLCVFVCVFLQRVLWDEVSLRRLAVKGLLKPKLSCMI